MGWDNLCNLKNAGALSEHSLLSKWLGGEVLMPALEGFAHFSRYVSGICVCGHLH